VLSPPLRDLVAAFMKPSQNLETDLIFAHVGEAVRSAAAPAWRTSEQSAVAALREFLRRNQLPADEVKFEEGSGLSRNNLTSANATVALLALMATHRDGESFHAALPIAAVDGTLRRRMRATPAEGNVRAKTGTLRWANSLSGYVTSAAGERLVFSVMLNRAVVPPGANARDDVDAIAILLAGFTGRSGEPLRVTAKADAGTK
jgi:serine-type D-Ala-D-Ala carboxypeptidase/endopeptidase (penicillin-binding protein 4)